MNDEYFDAMRQSLKLSGMTDEQIEAMINMQKAAMQMMPDMDVLQGAAANMQASAMSALNEMMDGSYFEFAEPSSISPSYQWVVACGADLTHLNGNIINDLPTSLDQEDAAAILSRDWGIDDKAEFMEMAESLKKGRHSVKYAKVAANLDKDQSETAENMREALEVFTGDGLTAPGTVPNMLIWDLGRLINITRFAFDAGHISREEALAILKDCAAPLQKTYKSWKELSVGYQFARAAWGGMDEYQYEMLKEGMEQLLEEEDSPWVTLDFNMKLDFSK